MIEHKKTWKDILTSILVLEHETYQYKRGKAEKELSVSITLNEEEYRLFNVLMELFFMLNVINASLLMHPKLDWLAFANFSFN